MANPGFESIQHPPRRRQPNWGSKRRPSFHSTYDIHHGAPDFEHHPAFRIRIRRTQFTQCIIQVFRYGDNLTVQQGHTIADSKASILPPKVVADLVGHLLVLLDFLHINVSSVDAYDLFYTRFNGGEPGERKRAEQPVVERLIPILTAYRKTRGGLAQGQSSNDPWYGQDSFIPFPVATDAPRQSPRASARPVGNAAYVDKHACPAFP